jgi:hypothetical protein
MKKEKKGKWIWKYRQIDPDITWEEFKSKYWTTTWTPKCTEIGGNIKL